ncbi:MAG: site-specific integrase [Halofilum sp. (in: g-proteobacteria)]
MAPKSHQNSLRKMVQRPPDAASLRRGRGRRLFQAPADEPTFPIAAVEIDWDRVIAQRETVLATVGEMPTYLLKPEVLGLLAAEKHPTYRLILDLMWSTGARISEVLALTRASFIDNGYDFGVVLETRKQGSGRRGQGTPRGAVKRYVPIADDLLADRIQSYLYAERFRKNERLFTMARQTVNRHIDTVVAQVGGAPFSIHAHTFRHSFAIHLLLHGRPLKYVNQLLGHRSIESTEIYLNVLTVDGGHLLEGVDFH